MKILCEENTSTFDNSSQKNLIGEAGLAGLTDTFNPDVSDGVSACHVVVYTIEQRFFLMLISCMLWYLCLYSTSL